MDLHKKYSLVKEHEHHFEIHDATDGKRFPIAKKDLHPASQIKLMKMQKFSEGGEAEDNVGNDDEAPSSSATTDTPVAETPEGTQQDLGMVPQFAPQPQAGPVGWQAPMLASGQAPAEGAASQPVVPGANAPSPHGFVGPGAEEQYRGMQGAAGTAAQLAKDQQAAFEQRNNFEEKFWKDHAAAIGQLDKEKAEYTQRLMDGKIQPNRYFDKMDTGKRISTVIGMILGGIGSGLTGGPNVAMQVINKAIDNDILSQKEELGKNQTLLSLNMQKYRDLSTAEAATRLQYNLNIQTQLQAAQSKATNGLAQANLHMNLAALQNQEYQYKNTIALNMAKANSLGYGGGEGGIPEGQEPFQLLADPKYQEKRVMVNGRAFQAEDKDAAQKVRKTQAIAGPVANQLHQLLQLSDDPMTKFAGTAANLRAHGIMNAVSVQLPQLSGLNRINETEIKNLLGAFQDPTRFDQLNGRTKTEQFLKTMEEDLDSQRSENLIGYKGSGGVKSFNPIESGMLPLKGKK